MRRLRKTEKNATSASEFGRPHARKGTYEGAKASMNEFKDGGRGKNGEIWRVILMESGREGRSGRSPPRAQCKERESMEDIAPRDGSQKSSAKSCV